MREDMQLQDTGETSIYDHDDENMPLAMRERRQTTEIQELMREKAQWGEFYRVFGMVLFLLGAYWLTVPFYNVICQNFGFTMSQSHKEYKFKED